MLFIALVYFMFVMIFLLLRRMGLRSDPPWLYVWSVLYVLSIISAIVVPIMLPQWITIPRWMI